jgi:hypothetical protein
MCESPDPSGLFLWAILSKNEVIQLGTNYFWSPRESYARAKNY